jgi:BirA family biotin operon repressor/biotin-[acetyl-CoA-carboxylase] ligase
MNTQDTIDLPRLNQALTGTRFAGQVRHFQTVESTNSLLLAAAAPASPEQPAPSGTVYLAEEQTAGRGRGGHSWHSAPGDGIYLSALVHLNLPLADALLLSLATGLAVQYAVHEATRLELDIRWPNDLMIANRQTGPDDPESAPLDQKKCGGILIETATDPTRWSAPGVNLRYAVIGIGLNVHQRSLPPELADLATSLTIADSARRDDPEDFVPIFRTPILIALLRCLDAELRILEARAANASGHEARARLLQRFTAASTWVHDTRVSVAERGGYTGTTIGLDEHGFLRVATDDGRILTVLSGGVRAIDI